MTAQDIQKLVEAAHTVQLGLTELIREMEDLGLRGAEEQALAAKGHADQAAFYLKWLEPF